MIGDGSHDLAMANAARFSRLVIRHGDIVAFCRACAGTIHFSWIQLVLIDWRKQAV